MLKKNSEGHVSDRIGQEIDAIENIAFVDPDAARKQLRLLLFAEGKSGETGSTGDALSILARRNAEHRDLAPVILRFLACQV
jgi:hypothetical protein